MDILAEVNKDPEPTISPAKTAEEKQSRRLRLIAALAAAEGMWEDRTDIPLDGVLYQNQLRDEWR